MRKGSVPRRRAPNRSGRRLMIRRIKSPSPAKREREGPTARRNAASGGRVRERKAGIRLLRCIALSAGRQLRLSYRFEQVLPHPPSACRKATGAGPLPLPRKSAGEGLWRPVWTRYECFPPTLSERQNNIAADGQLIALGAYPGVVDIEGTSIAEGGIIADFRAKQNPAEGRRHRGREGRLVIDPEGDLAIGRGMTGGDDPGPRDAAERVDRIERAAEGSDEEALFVTPQLAPELKRELVVEGVSDILRNTIGFCLEAIVTDIVEIGGEGRLVIILHHRGDGVFEAIGAVRVEGKARIARILGAHMIEPENGDIAVEKRQIDTGQPGDGAVIVTGSKRRLIAGVDTKIDIDHRIEMGDRPQAGMRNGRAEIEDIGVRIERVGGGRCLFRGEERRKLAELRVHAPGGEPG